MGPMELIRRCRQRLEDGAPRSEVEREMIEAGQSPERVDGAIALAEHALAGQGPAIAASVEHIITSRGPLHFEAAS